MQKNSYNTDQNMSSLSVGLLLDEVQEAIVVIQDELHKYVNKKAAEIDGYTVEEMHNKPIKETIYPDDYRKVVLNNKKRLKGQAVKYRYRTIDKNGQVKWLESYGIRILWDNRPATLCFVNEITAQINAENKLKEKSKQLEETNNALNVLLQHREKDMREAEEKIVHNVKELILPYIEKLKKRHLSGDLASYVDIIEKHAKDIISPFMMKMMHQYRSFTPREIQIASLIRDGKTTKEISELLNISSETVNMYRKRLRRKFQITNKDENLRTYLLFLNGGIF